MARKYTPKTTPNSETHRKASNAEISRRVTTVLGWITGGKNRADILRDGSERWNITERQVEAYHATATQRLAEKNEQIHANHIYLAIERLNMTFDDAFDTGDYKSALGAQHQLNKILALYAPVQQHIEVHHTWQDEAVSLIKSGEITYEAALETFDHDDRLVRELFAKAQVEVSTGQGQTS